MEAVGGREEGEEKRISLNVVSNKSRASVKVIFQGSSLPVVALS